MIFIYHYIKVIISWVFVIPNIFHSSLVVTDAEGALSKKINNFLRYGDTASLEDIVLDGHGKKLLSKSSSNKKMRTFLKTVPNMMVGEIMLY